MQKTQWWVRLFTFLLVWSVALYAKPGDIDISFGINGIAKMMFKRDIKSNIRGVALQSDGKIVVTGKSFENGGKIFVARFNSDGSLDRTFGDEGMVSTKVGNGENEAYDIAVQSDDKIVVAGSSEQEIDDQIKTVFTLVRYESNGTLDSAFGTDGIVTTQVGTGDSIARGIVLQSDGRIVVAGSSDQETNDQINTVFTLARYGSDGILDSTFGTDGIVMTAIGDGDANAYDIAIQNSQNSEKLVVVGTSITEGLEDPEITIFTTTRYDSNGSLDTTFGNNGIVTSDPTGYDSGARSVVVYDNKIIVVGESREVDDVEGTDRIYYTVIRYDSDGSVDDSFGQNGVVKTENIVPQTEATNNVLIQQNGNETKIVGGGWVDEDKGYVFGLIRFDWDGSIDDSFGQGGVLEADFSNGTSSSYALALQEDGSVVAAGDWDIDGFTHIAIVRCITAGGLDTTFGLGGYIKTVAKGHDTSTATATAVQKDGKIVAIGFAESCCHFIMARFENNGTLDRSFGSNGTVTLQLNTINEAKGANSLAIQDNGKIVVTAWNDDYFTIMRFDENGSLDTTFGNNGIVINEIGDRSSEAKDLALQNDGKIVAAGFSENGYTKIFTAVRYDTNGSLDDTFGEGGIAKTPIGSDSSLAQSIAIQNDGKIVLAGYTYEGESGTSDIVMVRYDTNGSLDTTFGTDGIVTTALGDDESVANSIALDKNGKIVVAGTTWTKPAGGEESNEKKSTGQEVSNSRILLLRYNNDGTLDSSFGSGGVVTTTIGDGSFVNVAHHVTIQNNGKIVIAGSSINDANATLVIARYNSDGSPDTSFGTNGIVTLTNALAHGVVLQENGQIVVAGTTGQIENHFGFIAADFSVFRFDGDRTTKKTILAPIYYLLLQ